MFNDLLSFGSQSAVEETDGLLMSLNNSLETNDLTLVTFRTKTGTMRQMGCTKKLSAIPEENQDGRFDPQLNRQQIICVYDFQNSAWRAFRKDRVVSFTTV